MPRVLAIGALLSLVVFALLGFVGLAQAADASPRMVHVEARQFAYSPGVIRVPQGTTIHLELASQDVTHGFLIPDLGFEARPIVPGTYQTVTFRAERPGVYRYYCNVPCSHRHGAMIGRLVVEPPIP